jgi:DNA-directed RNA polymerase specialized sigma24 family protein
MNRLTGQQRDLAARHAHLAEAVVREAVRDGGPLACQEADEMSGLAAIELCRLAAAWDVSRNKAGKDASFACWAVRLLRRRVQDYLLRMRRVRAGMTVRGDRPSATGLLMPLDAARAIPASAAGGSHEEAARAAAMIGLLPVQERRAVCMRHLLGKEWDAIGRKLRMRDVSARRFCEDGLARLRRMLEQGGIAS